MSIDDLLSSGCNVAMAGEGGSCWGQLAGAMGRVQWITLVSERLQLVDVVGGGITVLPHLECNLQHSASNFNR